EEHLRALGAEEVLGSGDRLGGADELDLHGVEGTRTARALPARTASSRTSSITAAIALARAGSLLEKASPFARTTAPAPSARSRSKTVEAPWSSPSWPTSGPRAARRPGRFVICQPSPCAERASRSSATLVIAATLASDRILAPSSSPPRRTARPNRARSETVE